MCSGTNARKCAKKHWGVIYYLQVNVPLGICKNKFILLSAQSTNYILVEKDKDKKDNYLSCKNMIWHVCFTFGAVTAILLISQSFFPIVQKIFSWKMKIFYVRTNYSSCTALLFRQSNFIIPKYNRTKHKISHKERSKSSWVRFCSYP